MRLSALPECSRELMHASMIACAISSMASELIPSSRARLPAARAAAISMSGTMGRVRSICRSAVVVMARKSWPETDSEGEKESGGGLDPVRDATHLVESQQGERIGGQDGGQQVTGRKHRFELGGAGVCEVVH